MSLRDWFAGQALAGLVVSHSVLERSCYAANGERLALEEVAYRIADRMLRARRGETP